MDYGQFDDLTRSVAGDGGTRRAVLRLLAGGVVGGIVARLGLTETAETKAKKKRKQPKPGEQSQPKGGLQTEGKRNKRKNRDKKRKEPRPPQPPPPPPCGAGQWRCADDSCVTQDQCCPDEKRCPDGCISANQCCSDERRCPDGSCVALDACCFPDEMLCPDDSCVSVFECCPGEKACGDSCIAEDACCDLDPAPLCNGCQQMVCENGAYVCQDRWDGVDCGSGYCCPLDPPYFCAEVPGHGRMCCRPGYGGGAFVCV